MANLLDIDHEAGNLDEYDSYYAKGAAVSADASAALDSTSYGLLLEVDSGSDEAWAQADFTLATDDIRSLYWLDPNSVTMGSGHEFSHYILRDATTNRARIQLQYDGSNYRLLLMLRNDAGGWHYSSYATITDAPHFVEIHVERATSPTSNDGRMRAWIDSYFQAEVTGVDNHDTFRDIEALRLGCVGWDGSAGGSFYLDEIILNDDENAIGPIYVPPGGGADGGFYGMLEASASWLMGFSAPPPPAPTPPEAEHVLVPGTARQGRGMTILMFEPLWVGSNVLDARLGHLTDSLRKVETAYGGYWSLTLSWPCSRSAVEEWLEEGLGRHVEVYGPHLTTVWEGFVSEVSAGMGGRMQRRGPLLDVANKIKVVYSYVDTSVTPPVLGGRTGTAWATNPTSQAKYGVIERIISVGGANATTAAQIRDTALADLAEPPTDEQDNLGMSAAPNVSVTCLGYFHWLKAYTCDLTTTGLQNASAKVQAVFGADPNTMFSTDYGNIDTNTTQVGAYDRDDRQAWAIVQGVTAVGDSSDNRWLCGLGEGRKAFYRAIPTAPIYQRRLAGPEQSLQRYPGGDRVGPWEGGIAGEWVYYTDFILGTPPTTLREDRRNLFVEQATFTMPWELTLDGSKVGRLDQLMSRLGLGGAHA